MVATTSVLELVRDKIKDLPPLPVVVQKLVRTLDDDSSSAEDVTSVLSSDQALASKVLKLVNSSFYGLSGEISTLSRAVVILGFAAIRSLAIGLSVAKFMSLGADGERQQEFWDHSIAVAAACRVLAGRTGYPDAEEAFVAGLLHDIGNVVLGIAVPDEYEQVVAGPPQDLLANEEKFIGLGHAKAGQMLLKHWKLPRSLTNALRFHHNPKIFCGSDDPLVSLVALADTLARVHGAAGEGSISSGDFRGLIAATGLDLEASGEVLAEMGLRIEETKVFLQIAAKAELAEAPAVPAVPRSAVLLGTDRARMTWTRSLLVFHGTEPISMKDFLARPESDDSIGLVILDAASVSAEQLQKLKARLVATPAPVALFAVDDEGATARVLERDLPLLPLAFSRADLARFV